MSQTDRMDRCLVNTEYEDLKWSGPFKYNNLVRLRTPTDGSCFFHSIAKSYFKPYIMNTLNITRRDFIKQLRKDLAVKLGSKVDPRDPDSPLYYDLLSRGNLRDFSETLPQYSLINIQNELDSDEPVDNVYNEFISDQLDKDIYVLDMTKHDVYVTGSDDDILYKGRPSIVILYLPGHYELVGLNDNGVIRTLFGPDHDLILAIRDRMDELRS